MSIVRRNDVSSSSSPSNVVISSAILENEASSKKESRKFHGGKDASNEKEGSRDRNVGLVCFVCNNPNEYETEPPRERIYCTGGCMGTMVHTDCVKRKFLESGETEVITYRCQGRCKERIRITRESVFFGKDGQGKPRTSFRRGSGVSDSKRRRKAVEDEDEDEDESDEEGGSEEDELQYEEDESLLETCVKFKKSVAFLWSSYGWRGATSWVKRNVAWLIWCFAFYYVFLGLILKAAMLIYEEPSEFWREPISFFITKQFRYQWYLHPGRESVDQQGVQRHRFFDLGFPHVSLSLKALCGIYLVWFLIRLCLWPFRGVLRRLYVFFLKQAHTTKRQIRRASRKKSK